MAPFKIVVLLNFLFGELSFGWYSPIRDPSGSDPLLVYTGGYYYLLTTTYSMG